MSGEILTQEQVGHLCNLLDGKVPPSTPPPEPKRNKSDDVEYVVKQVGKDVMKQLQTMHDGLARRFAAKISKMLQSIVDVRLTTVDQLHYSEFVFGCDNPTCYNLIQFKFPNVEYQTIDKGNVILDISPTIILAMIERMLGGGVEPSGPSRRPLTNIEWKLTQRIIDVLFEELKDTWKDIIDLECAVAQQESNPQMIRFVEPNAPVVVICFQVDLIEQRGSITLCIPVDFVKTLIEGE